MRDKTRIKKIFSKADNKFYRRTKNPGRLFRVSRLFTLKALFNNAASALKQIWAAWPYMLPVSMIRCKNEALKILHFKNIFKCFKEVNIDKWPDLPYPFPLIYCCVRMNHKPDGLLNSDIQSFCIPGCFLIHLNIIIQHRHQSSTIFF